MRNMMHPTKAVRLPVHDWTWVSLTLLSFLMFGSTALADKVITKNGQTLEGLIKSENRYYINLDMQGTITRMPVDRVTTGSGGQYKVYSAFWRALNEQMPPTEALPVPHTIPAPESWPDSDRPDEWHLRPSKPDWAKGFGDVVEWEAMGDDFFYVEATIGQ